MIKTKDMILASLFAAITFIMGFVKIPLPFSPVPITGQTFAVMLAGGLLNPTSAFLSLLIFDLLGAIGIPVFSGLTGGFNVLVGPTGGYILSWPFAAFLISLTLKNKKANFINIFISYLLFAIIFVYILGVTQLSFVTGMPFKKAILVGALPFIPGDLIKASIASYLTLKLKPIVESYEKRQG
ncbi:biotin transporter BioY [Thermoanaerobacter kivui]|uniref:Biotin transporter n=1 Tax=Thermoanaerobacter kivui TaxID=2325 RepID=A0A097AQ41_THEKI|nr:biotin transporter BioY [Thermoanaerobacter kivui]AIS51936.1 biotin transporter BioY [Thermoanaerobacter kivui]